jgi:hypothetical protein
MVSSGMLRRVALVRATRRNIPEDTILHSHGRENLKSYISGNPFLTETSALLLSTVTKHILLLGSGMREGNRFGKRLCDSAITP